MGAPSGTTSRDGGFHLGVFEEIVTHGHEAVHFGHDQASGLRCIVAIHSTALGPSLGGTRFYPYATDDEALTDVLRLSRGMTYKAACAGIMQGGGKAVIIGNPKTHGTDALFEAYGRFVESLSGRYITAEDVGTTVENMHVVATQTSYVTGLPHEDGGSGDPSPATARGVIAAMRAVSQRLWGTDDLRGRRVAIKGIGKVGMSLAERLHDRGAELIVADVNNDATSHAESALGAKVVSVEEIHTTDCDIFAPCALGADLNASSIPQLGCRAIAGSANNQLHTDEDADRIAERGILYAPDYVVNAGGIINIAAEAGGYSTDKAAAMIDRIFDNMTEVFERADRSGANTHQAAEAMAEERIAAANRTNGGTR